MGFAAANRMALLGWLMLATWPLWEPHLVRVLFAGVVLVQCLIYVGFVFAGKRFDAPGESPRGSFFSLKGVISLFRSPRAVLGGWVHILAFDLMVGLFIVADGEARGIPHVWLLPVLILTMMFGPAGLLAYLVIGMVLGGGGTGLGLL